MIIVATMLAVVSSFALFFSAAQSGERVSVEHVVEITDFVFVPETLSVRPGDTIRWINRDIAPHTATARDESWDTGRLDTGKAKSIVVMHGMSDTYFCRFHPMMVARFDVIVTP